MNRKTAFIVGCLLWLASPGAHAQAQSDMRLRMDSGFYIGVGLGRAEHRDFCNQITGGTCDSKDFSWNVFAGYQFNRYFAVEGGYVDFGKATASGFTIGALAPAAITTDSTAFELVGVASVPITDYFSLYAKAGVFRYDSDGTGTGAAAGAASDDGFEGTFGFGAEYSFYRNLAARLEWQRYLSVGSGVFAFPKGDVGVVRFTTRYKF